MDQKNIIILGSKGMLGQMVEKYFSINGFKITSINERFDYLNFNEYIDQINSFDDGIVVNCIGKIKQKTSNNDSLLFVNTILPLELSRSLKLGHLLIHPSTDCVFDGKATLPYEKDMVHDATDIYGWSKSLGERALLTRINTVIIRVSIIGPDLNSSKGLLSWFLNSPSGSKLKGYTNHFWNGITTLEWCKQLHKIILQYDIGYYNLTGRIFQFGTKEEYSKFEMLKLFNEVFKKRFEISPVEAEYTYRCLLPDTISVGLDKQLIELNEFLNKEL